MEKLKKININNFNKFLGLLTKQNTSTTTGPKIALNVHNMNKAICQVIFIYIITENGSSILQIYKG